MAVTADFQQTRETSCHDEQHVREELASVTEIVRIDAERVRVRDHHDSEAIGTIHQRSGHRP